MAHIGRVSGGKAARFQQYTDTLQACRALGTA
jgi:ketosteroid isomerase-like protein